MPKENMLLAELPLEERTRILPLLQQVKMEQEFVMVQPNQPIESVYFPVDAVASTLQLLSDGEQVECGLTGREGLVGIPLWLRQPSTPSRTLAQVPGMAWRMSREDFVREVVQRPESRFNELIAGFVHGFLLIASQTAACNRKHEVDQRLCRWLGMVHNRVPERTSMPLKQEFLAAMLGVQRPTVSTAANMLQKAGLIEYSRGRLTILNPGGLAQGACECLGLMEAQFDRVFGPEWRDGSQRRGVGTAD